MRRKVGFGSKPEVGPALLHVRSAPKSDVGRSRPHVGYGPQAVLATAPWLSRAYLPFAAHSRLGSVVQAECKVGRNWASTVEGRRASGNLPNVSGHAFGDRRGGIGIDRNTQGQLIPGSGLPLCRYLTSRKPDGNRTLWPAFLQTTADQLKHARPVVVGGLDRSGAA